MHVSVPAARLLAAWNQLRGAAAVQGPGVGGTGQLATCTAVGSRSGGGGLPRFVRGQCVTPGFVIVIQGWDAHEIAVTAQFSFELAGVYLRVSKSSMF